MTYVFMIFWVLMWETIGYFSVKAIKTRIEEKRARDAMAFREIQQMIIGRRQEKVHGRDEIVYNPFMGILGGEDSV